MPRQKLGDNTWRDLGPGAAVSGRVRGGEIVRGPAGKRDITLEQRVCSRGHVGQYARRIDGFAYCAQCHRDQNAASHQRRRMDRLS